MKNIIVLLLISSALFGVGMRKSGDTVVDNKHQLIWQDHPHNVKVFLTHEHAVTYCADLDQSGATNWRLPTVEEYKYIIDKSRVDEELMIDRAFYHIVQGDYWADDRTWMRNFGKYAYYVFFKSGSIYYQNRSYAKYVRCVRDM